MRTFLLAVLFALVTTAQDKTDKPEKKPEPAPAEEKPVVTHHTATVRGKTLAYTATAARMPIKNAETSAIEAQMFYVAYTLDGAAKDPSRRAVAFIFNGGPGSATIWLHMGCFGPKRVRMLPDGQMPPPPFHWDDNSNTILDRTDLVFVDAIGTGYSRATNADLNKKFWSVGGDIAAFGEFIRLYLQHNARWNSPVYLAGESYGTTRAAGLSGYLVDHGIALNGVVLISTVLNFQTLSFDTGNDLPYVLYLPTYSATANFHHKLSGEISLDEVEKFAAGDYALALQQGDALSASDRDAIATKLARYTGLSKDYILRLNLRVDLSHFDTELLHADDRIVGRLDGRFIGTNPPGDTEHPDFDPSEAAIRPPFTSAFGQYAKTELNYDSDLPYYVLGGGVHHWDFNTAKGPEDEPHYADTSSGLRRAFAKNRYLRLYVAEGLYDAATPYFAAEYTLNHMGLTPADHQNVIRSRFRAGHMVYIEQQSMDKLHSDMEQFFTTTAAGSSE